jgi:hypothetical protein
MIGAPLADRLMKHFASPTSVGVTEALLVLAAIYFVFMMGGALGYRVPPENWKPADWNPDSANKPLITAHQVHLNVACRTPQFWLLWSVLMLNVSAGIGILSMASPLLQEVFAGRLIGVTAAYDQLTPGQLASIAAIAAGFTGLLSLFNILGAFSGPRCPIASDAKPPTWCSSCWESCSIRPSPGPRRQGPSHCSCCSSASSCRCMAAASPRFRLISRTSSAQKWWAPYTGGC